MRFKSKPPLRVMLLLGLSILTTSCALTPPQTRIIETITKSDCVNWKTLSYSAKSDSVETVRQIVEQNARRASVCGPQ